MVPGLLAAFICIAVFLVTQIALVHVMVVTNRLKAMAITWLVLVALYVALYHPLQHALPPALLPEESVSDFVRRANFVIGLVVYLLMFLTYGCFYYTDHSLCLAYMVEIEKRPQKRMALSEIKQHFPYDAMLARRLEDLMASQYVVRDGEHYRLDTKGKCLTAVTGPLKRFLNLEPGG
jgi:hypothetical protein